MPERSHKYPDSTSTSPSSINAKMGARWKIKCLSIGIVVVLMACGTTLGFEYGQSGSFKAKPRGLMDFFGNMFQQNSPEDLRSWPNMRQSVSHWGLYQKPVQQPDYERHFYNFGEQRNDLCSDEGSDYSSLDFSCQEPSGPDNNPCGEVDSEYTDQSVACNDDKYGIRWKGSPLEEANIEIDEVIWKGGQSQWSTGGGVSEEKYEDEMTAKSTPNFSGLTNVDVHKCYPQNARGGNGEENGLHSKTSGNEYFVLVIKKDHLLGDAMKFNKTPISIDAIIGASLQPPNRSDTAPADGTPRGPSVNDATQLITNPTSTPTFQPTISPTKNHASSTDIPTSTAARKPDEAVAQSSDEPIKISTLENPDISISTTIPAITSQPNYAKLPTSSTKPAAPISKSLSDEVASQSINGPTKISLSSNPTYQVPKIDPVSKDLIPNIPIPSKTPTNYSQSAISTAVPAKNITSDSQSASPNNAIPIVHHAFLPTTVESANSQSEDPMINKNKDQGAIKTPQNIPESPERGSGLIGRKPEVIVNDTKITEAPVTVAAVANSNTESKEMPQSSTSSYSGVSLESNSVEETPTTIVNDASSHVGSARPTPIPAGHQTKSTAVDRASLSTKPDTQPKTAVIVNDMAIIEVTPQPTNFDSTRPSEAESIVGGSKPFGGKVFTDESALDSEATIVNDVSPVVATPQPTNVGSTELDDSTQVTGKTKPEGNSPSIDSKPKTRTNVNDMQDPTAEKPQTSGSDPSHLNGPSPVDSQSAVLGSDQMAMDSTEDPKSSQMSTVTTPAFYAEDNSPPTLLKFSPTLASNNTRTIGSYAGFDAVAGSQSKSPISSPNFGLNDVPTTVSTANPSLVTTSNPEFTTSERIHFGTTLLDTVSDATVTRPAIPNVDTISDHNVKDIGHTIKGLQDLVNKLLSTVNSGAPSKAGVQKPNKNPANNVTRPHSIEHHSEGGTRTTVNESRETDKIAIPKGARIADEIQGDLDSTPIVSASNPRVGGAVPPIETSTSSTEPATSSQSTKWNTPLDPKGVRIADEIQADLDSTSIVAASNPKAGGAVPPIESSTEPAPSSQSKKWYTPLDSKKDDAVSPANASIAIEMNTKPTVLSSQSPTSTLIPAMSPIPTRSDDRPPIKNDSLSISGVANSETTEMPDSIVNGTTLASKDPPTTDANAMLSVDKIKDKEPGHNFGSSIPDSISKPPIVNEIKISANGSLNRNSSSNDLIYNGSPSPHKERNGMPKSSSQLPGATVNQFNSSGAPVNDLSDNAVRPTKAVTDAILTTSDRISSPSPDLTTPILHPALSNSTQAAVNTSDARNSPDFTNTSQSPEVVPVVGSPNTLSSTPPDPATDEEPVESSPESTSVTFTESSYDASSFTSTHDPVPAEETTKSQSKPKGIHKILSFMSWMRGKKSADNATENAATQLIESAFDPIEEIIETSDNGLPVIDKDILPENLANWFLGFHSAEDEDTSHMSDVNESQSSEVPDASVEFNDLYHSFLEAAIHNINNVSSIVNASEPIGTPVSWWSRFREVEDAHNNISSTDGAETGSQSPTSIDRGFMEGDIHKVNDASPTVNGTASTWRRWMSKLRGYKNMLTSSLTLNGPSSEANQSSLVGTVHNGDDGSQKAENKEQSKGESGWFSKFWTSKSGHNNPSSNVNATQKVVKIETEAGRNNRSPTTQITAESSVGPSYFWSSTNGTSIGSNAKTEGVATAKTNNTDVDDESSTVKIIITKPKAEWMSMLADIKAAQEASNSTVSGTGQQSDMRSEAKANATSAKPRTYSHFHGSDFEVWSGEDV